MEQLIENLIDAYRDLDSAYVEFNHMLDSEPALRTDYAEWCEEQGLSLRNGFKEYAAEYIASQNSIWDTLKDFDNEE